MPRQKLGFVIATLAGVFCFASPSEKASHWSFSGNSQQEYRLRASDSPNENSNTFKFGLGSYLSDPSEDWQFRGNMAVWSDLGNTPATPAIYALGTPHTYVGNNSTVNVYELSVEKNATGFLKNAKFGRQEANHGPASLFDGLNLTLGASGSPLEFFLFGGRTVHFYETNSLFFEDAIASAGAGWRPSDSLRLVFDYRYASELTEVPAGYYPKSALDNSVGLSAWARHSESFFSRYYIRTRGSTISEAGASTKAEFANGNGGLELSANAQTVTLGDFNETNNPYYVTLGESYPNLKLRVDLWRAYKPSTTRWTLHGGWNFRQLINHDETTFNRNAQKVYLLALAEDLFSRGFFASATVAYDRGGPGWTKSFVTLGGAAGYSRGALRAELGTYYQRYEYIYYQYPEEVSDVRSVYFETKYKISKALSARFRYSFEVFDRILNTGWFTLAEAF